MICLDCQSEPNGPWPLGTNSNPVVGVCRDCGAAVCARHAVIGSERLVVVVAINRQVEVDPPARHLRCRQCAAAEQARLKVEYRVAS